MSIPNAKIIHAPDPHVVDMIRRRLSSDSRKQLEDIRFDSIALINAIVPNIYYFADVAMKSGCVFAADVNGTCPQHTTTLALFGDVASINAAMDAIEKSIGNTK